MSEGEVDIAGKNIQDYTYGSLRNTISVVPQKAQLFAGTIRDNLTFGCPDATEEQIEEALDISPVSYTHLQSSCRPLILC